MSSDDLISRKALLKRFEELKENPNNRLIDIVFLDSAMSVIDAAPAVDAEPVVHSKWEMIPVNGVPCYWCGNLNCARLMPFGCVPNELPRCPNCGAKMDKEKKT